MGKIDKFINVDEFLLSRQAKGFDEDLKIAKKGRTGMFVQQSWVEMMNGTYKTTGKKYVLCEKQDSLSDEELETIKKKLEVLRAEYETVLGENPHHKMKAESLIKAIEDKKKEDKKKED